MYILHCNNVLYLLFSRRLMENKRGRFIVFEGIDGSGKSTQIGKLAEYIRSLDKYQDVLLTREPTSRAGEIKKKLLEANNVFSDGEQFAKLFVEDRRIHTYKQILPELNHGSFVLCDRYTISTCAYQSAQGVDLDKLFQMHCDAAIRVPDLTFYVFVPLEVSLDRIEKRVGKKEIFETNKDYVAKLLEQHERLYEFSENREDVRGVIGKVVKVNGEGSREEVFERIKKVFDEYYSIWKAK